MHRGIARLVLVLVAFVAAALMGFGPAQAEGPSITAVVNGADRAPVPGVTVNVTGPDGFTGSAQTDAEGLATIAVPAAGKYVATLDVATLPGGVEIRGGPERTINVLQGDKKALFPVVPAGEGGDTGGGTPPKVEPFWDRSEWHQRIVGATGL